MRPSKARLRILRTLHEREREVAEKKHSGVGMVFFELGTTAKLLNAMHSEGLIGRIGVYYVLTLAGRAAAAEMETRNDTG